MILVPDNSWLWHFDEQTDRLLLDLSDDLQFATTLRGKQLTADAKQASAFSLDDTSHYYHLLECIGELPFSEPERVQVVLNAIAMIRFAKPQMPQSWFFREFNLLRQAPLFGEVVTLASADGYHDFLVIEPGQTASVCLLMNGRVPLDDEKCLHANQSIKVMNNRLIPFAAVCNQLLRQA